MKKLNTVIILFFICPTVYGGSENEQNMRLDDVETKINFMGTINIEKGIYDDDSRFFALYYRQVDSWYTRCLLKTGNPIWSLHILM